MNINALKTELTTDPKQIGYATMTDVDAAASLVANTRSVAVQSITGQDLFEAVDRANYTELSAADTSQLHAIISMSTILVGRPNTKAAILSMFGVGTRTRDNLAALQTRPTSRAAELGLGYVAARHVRRARGGS